MAKAVGLSRKITLAWLNKAAELFGEGLSGEAYREKLDAYLSFEIESPTVLRKTREILMRVWFYGDAADAAALRREALELLERAPEDGMAVQWCMLLAAYPVFADLCRLMGRISEFSETVTLSQLRQKLYDEWGERSTLLYSTDKIIAIMKELGAISAGKPGVYTIVRHPVDRPEVTRFMLRAAMRAGGGAYYPLADLNAFGVLYPFAYTVSREALLGDGGFTVTNFGGALSVSLRNGG